MGQPLADLFAQANKSFTRARVGLIPTVEGYAGNPWALVKDVQAARRSFTSDIQRAAILAPLVEKSADWEQAKAAREAAANEARREAAKVRVAAGAVPGGQGRGSGPHGHGGAGQPMEWHRPAGRAHRQTPD